MAREQQKTNEEHYQSHTCVCFQSFFDSFLDKQNIFVCSQTKNKGKKSNLNKLYLGIMGEKSEI